jgi:hypothetical protein
MVAVRQTHPLSAGMGLFGLHALKPPIMAVNLAPSAATLDSDHETSISPSRH